MDVAWLVLVCQSHQTRRGFVLVCQSRQCGRGFVLGCQSRQSGLDPVCVSLSELSVWTWPGLC